MHRVRWFSKVIFIVCHTVGTEGIDAKPRGIVAESVRTDQTYKSIEFAGLFKFAKMYTVLDTNSCRAPSQTSDVVSWALFGVLVTIVATSRWLIPPLDKQFEK